eukprot:jgi/Chlat1/6271/Chrsp44S09052
MAPPEAAGGAAGVGGEVKRERKITVVRCDMGDEQLRQAMEVAGAAFDKHSHFKDVATFIKKEYDKRYPSDGRATSGVYHCVVGSAFAAAVSHENRGYLQMRVDGNDGNVHVIIFKSKDSPFDSDTVELVK